ncbi:hypothetical protein B0H16DRAFT_1455883 [Mycena metata]|uniref:Uncharacterized protein n=1 Tax=Mycena metata TaxID=1033252 RepID=A0AAD7JEG9_9AGAR|nr:hypothetical protein B0H16DRAFT_1455883 [Mycena metata]
MLKGRQAELGGGETFKLDFWDWRLSWWSTKRIAPGKHPDRFVWWAYVLPGRAPLRTLDTTTSLALLRRSGVSFASRHMRAYPGVEANARTSRIAQNLAEQPKKKEGTGMNHRRLRKQLVLSGTPAVTKGWILNSVLRRRIGEIATRDRHSLVGVDGACEGCPGGPRELETSCADAGYDSSCFGPWERSLREQQTTRISSGHLAAPSPLPPSPPRSRPVRADSCFLLAHFDFHPLHFVVTDGPSPQPGRAIANRNKECSVRGHSFWYCGPGSAPLIPGMRTMRAFSAHAHTTLLGGRFTAPWVLHGVGVAEPAGAGADVDGDVVALEWIRRVSGEISIVSGECHPQRRRREVDVLRERAGHQRDGCGRGRCGARVDSSRWGGGRMTGRFGWMRIGGDADAPLQRVVGDEYTVQWTVLETRANAAAADMRRWGGSVCAPPCLDRRVQADEHHAYCGTIGIIVGNVEGPKSLSQSQDLARTDSYLNPSTFSRSEVDVAAIARERVSRVTQLGVSMQTVTTPWSSSHVCVAEIRSMGGASSGADRWWETGDPGAAPQGVASGMAELEDSKADTRFIHLNHSSGRGGLAGGSVDDLQVGFGVPSVLCCGRVHTASTDTSFGGTTEHGRPTFVHDTPPVLDPFITNLRANGYGQRTNYNGSKM